MMRHILLSSIAAGLLAAVVVAQQGPAGPANPARGGGRGGRGVEIARGEECPAGTTLVRVGTCQAPEFPPPSIVDYRPESSLVVEQHPVPRAKFPVVDIHSHTGPTPATIASLIAQMDALNIRVLNNLERRIRRCARAACEVHQEHAVCESLHRVRERAEPVSRRRAGLRPEGRGAARSRREERRDRSQDLQRDRHGHEEGGRHAAGDQRSRAVADLGDGRRG